MILPASALLVAVLICRPVVALAAEVDDAAVAPQPAFSIALEGAWVHGPVHGHVQTPSGGNRGTTSVNRPTLEELGIDNASVYDAELTLGWRPHEAFVGGRWFGMSEEETLEDELISAYERIHYDHEQDVPNDIEMEAAPLLRLGVEVRF